MSNVIARYNKNRQLQFTEEDKMPEYQISCISRTTKYLSLENICKHKDNLDPSCVFCGVKKISISDKNTTIKKEFLLWIRSYLSFNGIEFPALISMLGQMLTIFIKFPNYFAYANPVVGSFVGYAKDMGFEYETESNASLLFP